MATKKVSKATLKIGDEVISLTKSKSQAAVRYSDGATALLRKKGEKAPEVKDKLRGFEILNLRRGVDEKLDSLRAKPEVSVGTHVWNFNGETDVAMIPTGNLYIEFKENTDDAKQRELMDEFHLAIKDVLGPDSYRVKITPESPNPIKCAMLLQKKRIVKAAVPDLMMRPMEWEFSQPSGKHISTQWHLENTGQAVPLLSAPNSVFGSTLFTRGADAKVKAAWAHLGSLGSKSLKIAVIDTGFDVEHPALRGDGTKIRTPFNAGNGSTDAGPWRRQSDRSFGVYSHGTSCAAVAAGAWDAQGILGAAPNSRIIPIRLDVLTEEAICAAFNHALNNGADIISCSLGYPKPVPLHPTVVQCISKVARQGRGGRGIPIFIAAGNANPQSNNVPRAISDFGAHPEIMCITASTSKDKPASYSFFGPQAFLCAPTDEDGGPYITTATVDVIGASLQHLYTDEFGGTSSATPLVAGIAALMLTANPELTATEVRNILRQSADKIHGGYDANNHSQRLGFGRVNALAAVKAAQSLGGITQTPTTPNVPSTPSVASQKGKVINKFLNVRSGPGTANAKVGELKQGDIVNLFEKVSGFWRIGAGQFVSADFVEVIASNGAPATGSRQGKVTSSFLNVRTGPSTGNAKVAELKQGALVTLFETSSNGWHRIGTNRWVIGSNIKEV
jgi:Subtilase family/Bacterial SH3 domain